MWVSLSLMLSVLPIILDLLPIIPILIFEILMSGVMISMVHIVADEISENKIDVSL